MIVKNEAAVRETELEGDDLDRFETMLKYVYTADNNANSDNAPKNANGGGGQGMDDEAFIKSLLDCIGLYRVPDYYEVHGLKVVAVNKFKAVVDSDEDRRDEIRDFQVCEEFVCAHYENCAQVDCWMGQAVSCLLF